VYVVCHGVICVVDCGEYMGSKSHIGLHELGRLYTPSDKFQNVLIAIWTW